MKTKKITILTLVLAMGMMLLFTACSKKPGSSQSPTAGTSSVPSTTAEAGHGPATDTKNLKAATAAAYPVGTAVILKTDHMDGMMGAKGTVSGVYDTTAYAVDYIDSTTGKEVKGHRWVVHEELIGSEGKTYTAGDEAMLSSGHMSGMGGEGQKAVISKVMDGPVYMVDYTPTDGSAIVKNHQWVVENELEKP